MYIFILQFGYFNTLFFYYFLYEKWLALQVIVDLFSYRLYKANLRNIYFDFAPSRVNFYFFYEKFYTWDLIAPYFCTIVVSFLYNVFCWAMNMCY